MSPMSTTPEKSSRVYDSASHLTGIDGPVTVDRSVLRQNISGILETAAYNVARKNKTWPLFILEKSSINR